MILDGKIIACDRCKEPAISVKGEVIDLWYSGKAHAHGGSIQAVTAPDGLPLWVSDVEPGSVHDITAARIHALPALYRAAAAGLPTLADPGYDGAGLGILIPVKQPPGGGELDINTRTRNAILRSLRCLGERGFACPLKTTAGSMTFLLTGSARIALTNPANRKTITQNVSGPVKLIVNADGSTIYLGNGIGPFGLAPADQARFKLPGLFIFAGALTATTAPDGITTTSLTLHGHMVVNVCAALSSQ